MDKIICEVCGTNYPESSGQCPICGYVNPAKSGADETAYVPVKGGRFSASNVKRRSDDALPVSRSLDDDEQAPRDKKQFALGITVIAFLLILIAVLIFFIVKVINDRNQSADQVGASQTEDVGTTQGSAADALQLHTDSAAVTFKEAGEKHIIHAYTVPENATGAITYVSMDSAIASVDDSGTVTAVASGETAIVVRCEDATLIVTVNCEFGVGEKWSINRKDITLSKVGETWDLYSKDSTVAKNKITWSSDDESIAKISDGIVEAVANGNTVVRAKYNGTEYTCTIRCKITQEDEGQTTEPTQPDDDSKTDPATLKLWPRNDVTISVKETFSLQLRDPSGKAMDVQWKVSRDGYVHIDGNSITGLKSTANDFVTVSTTYGGETFKCIIRIR